MSSNFASLHSGLVARKGEAIPAVSHPTFSYVDARQPTPQPAPADVTHETPHALDTQDETVADVPVFVMQAPERLSAQAARKAASVSTEIDVPAAPQKPVGLRKVKKRTPHFRLSFRMTQDQRRRLRIAAAQKEQSLQHVLSDALDNYLDGLCACSLRTCACMARAD